MRWVKGTGALLALIVATHAPGEARACSVSLPEPHALEPVEQERDRRPPATIGEVGVRVRRGTAPRPAGSGGMLVSSCDDLGWIELRFEAPPDDRTPPAKLGYEIALVAGNEPVRVPESAVRMQHGMLWLAWNDGATDDQEPLDFTISITPVDLGGQRGLATTIAVRDPGTSASR